jgi:hypothetical protein
MRSQLIKGGVLMNRTGKVVLVFAAALVAVAFIVVGFSMLPFSGDKSLGAEGCCMSRECPDDTCTWYVHSASYEKCQELNEQADGDNVVEESGVFWWSSSC